MRKLVCLFLALAVAVCSSPAAFALVVEETEDVGASVILTGTPYVDVAGYNVSDDSPYDLVTNDLSWTGVVLGSTGWQAADQYMGFTYLLPAGGGISLNTQNPSDDAGLIGAVDGSALSMAWRAFTTAADVDTTIYQHVYSEPDDAVDYNGDGDQDDYIAKLVVEPTKPLWADLYAVWIWMLDGSVADLTGDSVAYSSPVNADGIQHAEMTFDTWGGSPDFILPSADFTAGTPQEYTADVKVELYSL